MCDEVLALHSAPFCTDLIDRGLVIASLSYFLGQFKRDVKRECLGKYADLTCCREGFETGDDRYVDACSAALLYEVIVDLVVEEHLCDHIVRTSVDLAFQICDVGLKIRRLEMLLRICSHSDAEVSVVGFKASFSAVRVASLVASDSSTNSLA